MLTLSATPIPRTLQLALTGVRELSLIATPPVDRLAVRTFVTPFDPLIVREALLASAIAAGKLSMSCRASRISREVKDFLDRRCRRRRSAVAHGQMAAGPARGRDDGLLRGPVRHPALDHDRRIRSRYPDGQHADRPPGRHVRPRAALPAARSRRPREDPRLRAVHGAGEQDAHRAGRAAAEGAAIARHARAPGSSSPSTTSTSAAPATCSATSNPVTSRRSATNSTSRCWRRRWRS